MDIIQIVLLAVLTFIIAIDQFSLTEIISRPIINCTLIGLILGDMKTGLILGGTYELAMVGNMPVGGAQPPNAVLGAIVAMVFAVKSDLDINAAIGACMIFALFGQYVVTLTFTIMSGFMVKADKAAENADAKGIRNVNLISMCILGGLFAALAVAAYVGGTAAQAPLKTLQENASWIMGGLSAAGGMMRFVGFAILLKIMLSNDLWGFLLAGFGATVLIDATPVVDSALILIAFIGFAIAFYDYQTNVKIKENAGNGNGGMTDGI